MRKKVRELEKSYVEAPLRYKLHDYHESMYTVLERKAMPGRPSSKNMSQNNSDVPKKESEKMNFFKKILNGISKEVNIRGETKTIYILIFYFNPTKNTTKKSKS